MVIYSNKEFQAATRLERIYMAMIEPDRFEALLSYDEQAYMDKLQLAYHGCWNELRYSAAIFFIQNNIQGCETMYKATRLLEDMQTLYGRFLEKNKQLKLGIVVERMYEAADRMLAYAKELYLDKKDEDGNVILADKSLAIAVEEKAMLILEKAAKMDGLDKIQTGFNPRDFQLPAVVVTSDARVLREGGDEEE